ncbi:MAG: sugar phosphate isomerase/epimerase [Chloroflexi bacterium]|nr:sugar phosphate isomerase/epimerase [Chloroflexota bacterium]
MNPIGMMQGRLSPPDPRRIQAFPWPTWQDEFSRARDCGFDALEWLFEEEGWEQNPIWSAEGEGEIRKLVAESDVEVRTCCADYFMPHPFFRVPEDERLHSIDVLEKLITRVARVGIQTILLPVLEVCEIRSAAEEQLLLESLRKPLDLAAGLGVRLGLETELDATHYRRLVDRANHPALGAYYDTGNNAAQGHDIATDAQVLGEMLVGVHVKDRKRGGPTVLLGQGDADLEGFFRSTKQAGYTGPVILQTAFGPDYMGIAKRHLDYVRNLLDVSG